MYTPPAFAVEDTTGSTKMMRQCRSANFVTATPGGRWPPLTYVPR